MKFIITRTYDSEEKPPVAGLVQELVTWVDRRTVKTIKEARKCHWFNYWYERGENHREENGMVACDVKKKQSVWTKEFSEIKEIADFVNSNGRIVIEPSGFPEVPLTIEIYDTYRE